MGLPLIGLKKKSEDALFAEQSVPVTAFLGYREACGTDGRNGLGQLRALLGL